MESKAAELREKIEQFVGHAAGAAEKFRLQFISKKGEVAALFEELKKAPAEQKKQQGKILNELKQFAEARFAELLEKASTQEEEKTQLDLTLPTPQTLGNRHPVTLTRERITEVFARLGFNAEDGPEIDNDWNNFTALNFSENHPAREMQDTFFIEKNPDVLLRTHTSNVQIRLMNKQKPPIRSIMPGRVYRNETISARAHCFFHQTELLHIDKNVSFADLKQTIYHFAKEMFGAQTKIRLRPSYFPFTEPSAEIDVSCFICCSKGCHVCKHSGWVEIAGAGMVHPNVLRNCDIDPEQYTGFAGGMGIERIAMLRYGINDLRLFSENDVRFLKQFKEVI